MIIFQRKMRNSLLVFHFMCSNNSITKCINCYFDVIYFTIPILSFFINMTIFIFNFPFTIMDDVLCF